MSGCRLPGHSRGLGNPVPEQDDIQFVDDIALAANLEDSADELDLRDIVASDDDIRLPENLDLHIRSSINSHVVLDWQIEGLAFEEEFDVVSTTRDQEAERVLQRENSIGCCRQTFNLKAVEGDDDLTVFQAGCSGSVRIE